MKNDHAKVARTINKCYVKYELIFLAFQRHSIFINLPIWN